MKNILKILMLLLFTASLTSCEWIGGLFSIDIETTIEGELDILTEEAALKAEGDPEFHETATIQIMNEDLVEYEDLIDDIRAESVTIRVGHVDTEGVIIHADTEFGISNPNAEFIWTLNSDWAIEQGFQMDLPAESYSVLNQILNEYKDHPVTISADGECNKASVYIKLNYEIDVVVESSPL